MNTDWWNKLSHGQFQDTFRMSWKSFTDLQAELDQLEDIDNEDPDIQLLACLWLLGNNDTFEAAQQLFGIENLETSFQRYLSKIIQLGSFYIRWPTEGELDVIENSFANEYSLNEVVGLIGSLYVEIAPHSDLAYYNKQMQKFAFVLQIVCDNNLLLRDICIGCPGGYSIQSILRNSPLYDLMVNTFKSTRYLLGGTIHANTKHCLVPFQASEVHLSAEKQEFNRLHEVAMKNVGVVFCSLGKRFPRLEGLDKFKFSSMIVGAICILYNFTTIRNDCYFK